MPNYGMIKKYIKQIRNHDKRRYAEALYQQRVFHPYADPPVRGARLSVMAAQAVRMKFDSLGLF